MAFLGGGPSPFVKGKPPFFIYVAGVRQMKWAVRSIYTYSLSFMISKRRV